jgi:SAM-dependent methyltransferase
MKAFLKELFLFLARAVAIFAIAAGALVATHFPYDTDRPLSAADAAKARNFYAAAYDPRKSAEVSPEEEKYAKMALDSAHFWHVTDQVADFARQFQLTGKKVLDIGSGQGYLQDVVADYTGLDISPSVGRYYHKRFVLGSATALPFPDDTFDGAWSIWVFEHVPNPEAALNEARRVVKDGGVLFLGPTWDCVPWAADGYDVRPYRDFGVWGKLAKAAIPVRRTLDLLSKPCVRLSREIAWRVDGAPTTSFHYNRLAPNYQTYWEPDSDAVNSLDFAEMGLWFRSRGDECLSCARGWNWLSQTANPLVIRIHKRERS